MPASVRRRLRIVPAALLALALAACDRNLEPFVSAENEPPPPERPVRVPGLESPAPRATMPMGPPEGAGARTGASQPAGEPIRGRIVAAEEVGGDGVLFLIARSQPAGPPLAVKRLPVGPFPLEFEIGPADVMIRGMPFAGPITLTARVDRDGNAMTREPGAAAAALAAPVSPGTTDVELRLEVAEE